MILHTLQYEMKYGWSQSVFPDVDSPNTLIIVFGAPEFIEQPEVLKDFCKKYPNSTIIGCSSSGEIYDTKICDLSLSVAILKFENTVVTGLKTSLKKAEESNLAGKSLAEQLNKPGLKGIVVLSDGLHVNGTELVKGINSAVPENVEITGGLAGDGKRFEKTWTLFNGELLTDAVVAVGLYGDKVHISHASKGGWDIFGPERMITNAKGNVLFELDGQPALKIYKEYLGELAAGLPASGLLYPLSIRSSKQDDNAVVRTILSVDENNQSLTFAGDMPVGWCAQLMRANFERLISSAGETGEIAIKRLFGRNDKPKAVALCIAISCVGRRLVLGERTEEELEALKDQLPENTAMIGFYSYGELSPLASGRCQLHNQTMTITLITEE